MGQLSNAYNEMADTVEQQIGDIEASEIELARHRDNLEELVKERTRKLEKEIVERKRVETLQTESQERLRLQNVTLLRLAGDEALHTGDLNASLQVMMQAAGEALQVERSSVWLFDEHRLKTRCHEMYLLSANRHSQGGQFRLPHFLALLMEQGS